MELFQSYLKEPTRSVVELLRTSTIGSHGKRKPRIEVPKFLNTYFTGGHLNYRTNDTVKDE